MKMKSLAWAVCSHVWGSAFAYCQARLATNCRLAAWGQGTTDLRLSTKPEKPETFSTLTGRNGLSSPVLSFRDWCPFARANLSIFEHAQKLFAAKESTWQA